MKKIIALRSVAFVIIIAMVAVLSGCSAEEPAGAEGVVRVGMVFDVGGKGDKSFNDSAYRGLLHAADEFGVEHTEFEPGQDADRETGLRKLAQAGYDVIIGVGFLFSDAMRKVAADYPDVKFACVDFDARPGEVLPPNLAGLRFREEEGSFLVGVVAGDVQRDRPDRVRRGHGHPADPQVRGRLRSRRAGTSTPASP